MLPVPEPPKNEVDRSSCSELLLSKLVVLVAEVALQEKVDECNVRRVSNLRCHWDSLGGHWNFDLEFPQTSFATSQNLQSLN